MKKMVLSPQQLGFASAAWRFRKPMEGTALLDDSRGRLLASLWGRHGIEGELIAVAQPEGYILVDGYRRLAFALHHGIEALNVSVFASTEREAIMQQIQLNEYELIVATPARKAAFVFMLKEAGIDDAVVIKEYLPLMGLEAHPAQLARCCKIGLLGRELLEFCHEKGFALSQCFHLTRHPRGLVEMVFGWREHLALSASQFEQTLDMLRDIMIAQDLLVEQLPGELGLHAPLTAAELTPQQRTKTFLAVLRARRQPLLTEINAKLQTLQSKMALPREVSLTWDQTLEREQLTLTIAIDKIEAWTEICRKLSSPALATLLSEMLKEL